MGKDDSGEPWFTVGLPTQSIARPCTFVAEWAMIEFSDRFLINYLNKPDLGDVINELEMYLKNYYLLEFKKITQAY